MTSGPKAIVVTGGSRGLGLSIVTDLLDQGYRVATCSRGESAALVKLRQRVEEPFFLWMPCTIGDEHSENAFMGRVLAWLEDSHLHGLVNNSGIAGEGILATFPNVDSEKIISTNLLGPVRMARLVLRTMLGQSSGGRIINISSITAVRGYTGLSAYSASKAGLDGLTRALAREVGRREITVNSVAPGYFDSDLSASLQEGQRRQIIRRTPLGRLATAEDVVPVVRFLMSDDARFITGQTIVVDGGITC